MSKITDWYLDFSTKFYIKLKKHHFFFQNLFSKLHLRSTGLDTVDAKVRRIPHFGQNVIMTFMILASRHHSVFRRPSCLILLRLSRFFTKPSMCHGFALLFLPPNRLFCRVFCRDFCRLFCRLFLSGFLLGLCGVFCRVLKVTVYLRGCL